MQTDFGVIFEYYYFTFEAKSETLENEDINPAYFFFASCFSIILYRFVSCWAIYRLTKSKSDVFLQLFDFLIIKSVWKNYQTNGDEPSNTQRYLQILEATWESSIQLLVAIVYLSKTGLQFNLIFVSSLFSLFSLTSRITSDDKAIFEQRMQNLELNIKIKNIKKGNFNDICNPWYFVRVFMWRLLEVTTRMFLCTLMWINLGGFALTIILMIEFVYLSFACYKLKTIDFYGAIVYVTFANSNEGDITEEEEFEAKGDNKKQRCSKCQTQSLCLCFCCWCSFVSFLNCLFVCLFVCFLLSELSRCTIMKFVDYLKLKKEIYLHLVSQFIV